MAKPLETRVAAALRSAARQKDVEAVISDVKDEIGATQVKLDQENARSVDPALTTPEAREARNNAADLEHDIRRLNASLGMLTETLQKLVADDKEAKRLEAYETARSERDALARHIRTQYPVLALALMDIVKRIQASDAKNVEINQSLPNGKGELVSAEGLARGFLGHYWPSSAPVQFLKTIHVPFLTRKGDYLPLPDRMGLGHRERLALLTASIDAERDACSIPIDGIEPAPDSNGSASSEAA